MYYSRDARTGALLRHETIGGFLALYAGVVPDDRVDGLVSTMTSPRYLSQYGVASVPIDDPQFHPRRYWQGPVWVNMNWLIADGLDRYGRTEAAQRLRDNTVEMISASGSMFEYYSPLDGTGAGSNQFSWTAALLLDLLARERPSLPSPRAASDSLASAGNRPRTA